MTLPRISIAKLMGIVALVALAIAALLKPSVWWAGALYSSLLVLLLLAPLGILFQRGNKQRFWAGFALFGWTYLLFTLRSGPVSPPIFTPPDLIPIAVLPEIFLRLHPKEASYLLFRLTNDSYSRVALPFNQTAHSLSTLCVALLGAFLARTFLKPDLPTNPLPIEPADSRIDHRSSTIID